MKIRDIPIPLFRILTVGLLPSPVKKLYYRMKGHKIGRGTSLGLGSVIDVANSCEIGEGVKIGIFSVISGKTLRIGKRSKIRSLTLIAVPHIEIGSDVVISETAIIRAQQPFRDSRIVIDNRAHIFPFTIIDPSRPVRIGSEAAVGLSTYIFSHGAYKDKLAGFPINYGEVNIGNSVWLTNRIFVMPGVTLGDNVVVGSGSVVTRSFPDACLIFGIPARVVKRKEEFITQYTQEKQFEMLKEIFHEFQDYVNHFYKMKAEMISDVQLKLKELAVAFPYVFWSFLILMKE